MKMILFLLLITITHENCNYYYYLDNNNNTQCTSNYSCPEEYNKLIKIKRQCIKDCKNDLKYKYEYKYECLEECPSPDTELINETYCSEICTEEKPYQNTLTHECISKCDLNDLLLGICVQKYDTIGYENITDFDLDKLLDELEKLFNSFNISDLDFDLYDNNIKNDTIDIPIITLKTRKLQNNNNINLIQCEKILRKFYGIDNNVTIGFDIIRNSNTTEYLAYYFNGTYPEKLDMSLCEDVIIKCNIEQPFLNITYQKCEEKCEINDFLNKKCILYYEINNTKDDINSEKYKNYKNIFLNYVENIFTSEQFYENISYSLQDNNLITNGNMRIILTTSDSNNQDKNKSSINLGECENRLKEYYKINKLYIKKIEYFDEENIITNLEYDMYGELNNSKHLIKLNKSICHDGMISTNTIIEMLYITNIYENNNNDICSLMDSDDKINLSSNEKEDNNIANICKDNNCVFVGYDEINKKVKCSCGSKIINHKYFNFKILSCKVFSNMKYIKSNYGYYILTSITSTFFITMIIFYIKGFTWLENKMNKIIKKKFENNIPIVMNFPPKKKQPTKMTKKSRNKNNTKEKQNNGGMLTANDGSKNDFNKKNFKGNTTSGFEQNLSVNINNTQSVIQINSFPNPETDYELNWLSYKDALKFDKRGFCGYYCSLIKTKQLILFSFCSINDYNSNIIKKTFIFLSFVYHYTFNSFLFSDTDNDQIINDNISYNIPSMLYSSLLSIYILRILIMNLALNDKDVLEVKNQVDKNTAINMKEKNLKCVKYKITIFYLLNLIILGFSWYYLICFNAVFKKKQTKLIINTCSSFIFSLIYPLFSNLFPTIFRNCVLNSNGTTNECCYSLSKITQLIFI